jgi:transposase InsO family protein
MENDPLEFEIRRVFAVGRGEYGSPTFSEALSQEGFAVNHKRIARLMRQMGLSSGVAKRFKHSTKRCKDRDASPPGAWQCKEPYPPGIDVSRELTMR